MQRAAFILIMSVRLLALFSIVVGIALMSGHWADAKSTLILVHFLLGFLTTSFVLGLGIIALLNKLFPVGLLSLLFAFCLPVTGFLQLASIGPHLGAPQIVHIVVIVAAIGLAEATTAKIKRTTA